MNQNPIKLDAGEEQFFTRELAHIKAQAYEVKHALLKAVDLIPVSTEAPSGSDTIIAQYYDGVGVAKIVADFANDFPRVDVFGKEKIIKVRSLGDAYGYSIKEIRRSQKAGNRLETRRALTARRAIDELVNKLAWLGDADYNIQGFINYPGITEYVTPVGAGAGTTWASKTSTEILADVAGMLNAVIETTNGREVPDTLILPIAQYNLLAFTPLGDNKDKTILTFIRENYPQIRTIDWVQELKGAGAMGVDRAMMYTRSPTHLTLEMPQLFEQFQPQAKGMEFEIVCHAECAGVIVYYPLSVAFADGI